MKRTLSKLLALVLIVTVIGAMAAVPAMASEPATSTNLNNENVTITKHLVLIGTEYVPNVTFTYTVANDATASGGVFPGTLSAPISDIEVAFTSSTTSSENFSSTETALSGQHYVDGTITVSGITNPANYERPGVYRYTITETAVSSPYAIVSNQVQYIDVCVEYTTVAGVGDALTVSNVILYKNALTYGSDGSASDGSTVVDDTAKTTDFTNSYETHSMTFSKKVTGNQGDKTKYFSFNVIADSSTQFPEADKYKITMTDVTFPNEGNTLSSTTTFVTGEQLNTGFNVLLKDSSSVLIEGIPATMKVKVTETPDGYTQNFGEGSGVVTQRSGEHSALFELSEDGSAQFTNKLEGTVPTGILLTIAPFAVGLLLFGSIVIFLVAKKRRAEEED